MPTPRLLAPLLAAALLAPVVPAAANPLPLPGSDPAVAGRWDAPVGVPVQAEAMAVLPTGKVLALINENQVMLFDPATGTSKPVPLGGDVGINCAGIALLPDGRVLLNGGHQDDAIWQGHRAAFVFDPWTETWSRVADMNDGRYYPATIALGDGRMLTLNGNDAEGNDPGTGETYDGSAWTRLPQPAPPMEMYPRVHVLPSGEVVRAGQDPAAAFLDPVTGAWRQGPRSTVGTRWGGVSVLLPGLDRVLVFGGGNAGLSSEGQNEVPLLRDPVTGIVENVTDGVAAGPSPATTSAEILDLRGPQPVYRPTGSMTIPRRDLAGVVLADGDVLALGGAMGVEPIPGWGDYSFHPELYDVSTERWSLLAPAERTRGYHSTGLLLPDGRVLYAGGDFELSRGTSTPLTSTTEIFSPPYLFRGPRPVVVSAPAAVAYGEGFLVRSAGARVAGAALVRLGSATHSLNTDQRWVGLDASVDGPVVRLTAPPSGNHAPPGYYMLFLLSDKGVPSISSIVRVG